MKRLGLALFLVVACSSTSEPVAPTEDSAAIDTAVVEDSSSSPDTALGDTSVGEDVFVDSTPPDTAIDTGSEVGFGPYPAGPYGNKLGDVMANLVWEGYVNDLADAISNTKPYVASVSMDDLRKKATKGYALVHVSEFY